MSTLEDVQYVFLGTTFGAKDRVDINIDKSGDEQTVLSALFSKPISSQNDMRYLNKYTKAEDDDDEKEAIDNSDRRWMLDFVKFLKEFDLTKVCEVSGISLATA